MATQTSERAGAFSFQIGRNDLGPLVVDAVGLECDAWSPLAPLLESYRRGAGTPSAEAARIAADPTAAKALRILARPPFRMVNHTGGGSLPASYFTACGSLAVDGQAVAVLNPSYEGACLIQIFDRPHAFLAWWLILNAAQADAPMANYLPPPIRFESLVYLLHAVDAFRRGAYRSLLEYRPTDRASISPKEFAESMRESLRTRDLRWLMPAYLSLTPNLTTIALEDGPQSAEGPSEIR